MRIVVPSAGRLAPGDIEDVLAALRSGALLVYPTDTLYALGGLVRSAEAAGRVRAAKGREAAKALPAVAADLDQVRQVAPALSDGAMALAAAFWPGPLTLVLRAAADLPEAVTAGTGTIALRVPDNGLTRDLCRLAGPLISTSANRSGEPPASRCDEAVAAVGDSAALAVDGGPGATTQPSTIVDATGAAPILLRAGAVAWEAVTRVWS